MMSMEKESGNVGSTKFATGKQRSTSLVSKESLWERLKRGADERTKFVESHLAKNLAFQIRSLRDRRDWSQGQLAEKVGMNQNAISRLENPGYGKATLTTLKRLATVFDVALVVRFVPFTELVDWVSSTPRVDLGLSRISLNVPSFDEQLALSIAHATNSKKTFELLPKSEDDSKRGNNKVTSIDESRNLQGSKEQPPAIQPHGEGGLDRAAGIGFTR